MKITPADATLGAVVEDVNLATLSDAGFRRSNPPGMNTVSLYFVSSISRAMTTWHLPESLVAWRWVCNTHPRRYWRECRTLLPVVTSQSPPVCRFDSTSVIPFGIRTAPINLWRQSIPAGGTCCPAKWW